MFGLHHPDRGQRVHPDRLAGRQPLDQRDEDLILLGHVVVHVAGERPEQGVDPGQFGVPVAVDAGDLDQQPADPGQFAAQELVVGVNDVVAQDGERGGRPVGLAGRALGVGRGQPAQDGVEAQAPALARLPEGAPATATVVDPQFLEDAGPLRPLGH